MPFILVLVPLGMLGLNVIDRPLVRSADSIACAPRCRGASAGIHAFARGVVVLFFLLDLNHHPRSGADLCVLHFASLA